MASKKAPAKAAKAAKPVKEVMNKSGLVNFIAEQSGVAAKDVKEPMAKTHLA